MSMADYGPDDAYGAVIIDQKFYVNSHRSATPALALCNAYCLAMAEMSK